MIDNNVKSQKIHTEYESALHLTNKIRQIRDNTTDSFIETFFKHSLIVNDQNQNILNDRARSLFLLYVYDVFKYNI